MGIAVGSSSICSFWLPPSLHGTSPGVTGGVMPNGFTDSGGVITWGVNIGVVAVGTTELGTETFSPANRTFGSCWGTIAIKWSLPSSPGLVSDVEFALELLSLALLSSSLWPSDGAVGGSIGTTWLVSVLSLARVPAVIAHGNPHASSNNFASCCSGCGNRRIDRTVIAPALVRTIAESSASVLPTKIPLNQRGLLLLRDFTLGTLHMTTSPNCTIGDVYSRPVTFDVVPSPYKRNPFTQPWHDDVIDVQTLVWMWVFFPEERTTTFATYQPSSDSCLPRPLGFGGCNVGWP